MTTAPGRTPHEVALICVIVGGLSLALWLATTWQVAAVGGGTGLVAALAASYLRDRPED